MIISETIRNGTLTGLFGLVVGILVGISIGWKLYAPEQVVEGYAPQEVVLDDIIVLERKPMPPPPELVKAAKKVDGKLERAATMKLQPKPKAGSPDGCECQEITLDIGTVDQEDGKRTLVSTDDAIVLGGVDIPLEPYTVERKDTWEVGVIAPVDYVEGVGPTVARRIGPFKLGVAAMRDREDGWTGMVSASISF